MGDNTPDFEAEGLLDGLDGDERRARLDLLRQLHDDGVAVDELRRAVKEERLALLPAERVLGGHEQRYTAREIAKRSGLSLDFLEQEYAALGLVQAGPDERVFDAEDLEAACDLRRFTEAGLDEDGIHEAARVIGEGMSRAVDAIGDLASNSLMQPGDTERDLGLRFAALARELTPLMGRQLHYLFKRHLREFIRNEFVSRSELETGMPDLEQITVCFADLVGFTKLGEELPAGELGRVAGRLTRMAADVVSPPVKLVKTIGDAAMLVSHETEPLIEAALSLVELADDAGEDFPQLRSGVAHGEAVGRGGDWYGRPVNVASRVTAIARPGSVLATREAHDAAEASFKWSSAGRRRLKGVKDPVPLFRARRATNDDG